MLIDRNCPICDSAKKNKIDEINFILFENHPINKGYDLVQCNQCSFIFADVKVSQLELDNYYSLISKYEDKLISTGGGYNDHDRSRLIGVANYISKIFVDKNIRIADVGCAIGGLLEQLRNNGFNNIVGIDPSKSCVEITKNEKNIDCIHSSLFDLNDSFGKFDLIIISHVWEHILDLSNAINCLEKILSPNGFIYIECPNAMNYRNTIHAPLQEFNTEHINHFCENDFMNFFGIRNYSCIDIGNKIVKIASGEDYDALYGIFQKNQNSINYELKFDNNILISIEDYINKSRVWFFDILNRIESELTTEQSVAVYGVGQFAFKLLYEIVHRRPDLEIILFDNNTLNSGKKIANFNINKGDTLTNFLKTSQFKIIITSLIHQTSIKNNIIDLVLKNNLEQPEIIELK